MKWFKDRSDMMMPGRSSIFGNSPCKRVLDKLEELYKDGL